MIVIFWCDKTVYLQLCPYTTFFGYPALAHILTHSLNLAFGPKSGFKNKRRARSGFGLQNEARLQL